MNNPDKGPEGPPTDQETSETETEEEEEQETEEAVEEKEEVPNKDWIRLDEDTEIKDTVTGETKTVKESNIVAITANKETYDVDNGVIALEDENEVYHVAPKTRDRVEKLRESDYEKGGCGVPLSSQWEPADPDLKERWEKAMEQAREDWE